MRFRKPATVQEWKGRVHHNVRIYAAQYMTVALIIGLVVVLSHPWRLAQWTSVSVVVLACIRCWYVNEPWTVYSIPIHRREQCLMLGPLAVALVVFGGLLQTIVWVLGVTMVLDVGHASLRVVDVNTVSEETIVEV